MFIGNWPTGVPLIRLYVAFPIAIALALSLLLADSRVALAEQPDDSRPTYNLDVSLNIKALQASVQQTVRYVNRSSLYLSELVFQVTPTRYKAFKLAGAAVNGQPASATLDGAVLSLPLSARLAPGEVVTATMAYSLTIPTPGDLRYGYSAGVLALGNWFPILSVVDGKGWRRQQYVPIGDPFVSETADYLVRLTLDQPAKVAHTGRLVQQDSLSHTFVANDVRDFALAVSPRYATLSQNVDGVEVTVFYLPEQKGTSQALLKYVVETLQWAAGRLGGYPYSTLQVAVVGSNDPAGVGQEYPTLFFVSNMLTAGPTDPGSYFNYIVSHEIMHEWFYSQVGVDQVYEPWIDEGLATMLTYEFYKDRYPELYQPTINGLRARLADSINIYGSAPMDTPIQGYSDEGHYFAILYRRSAVFFLELKTLAGQDAFYQALREIIGLSQSGRLVTGGQVIAAFARHLPADRLDELVGKYFRRDPRSTLSASPTAVARPTTTATTAAVSPTVAVTRTATPATNTPTPSPTETRTPTPTATIELSPTSALVVLATATWTVPAPTPKTVAPAGATMTPTVEQPAQSSQQADQSFDPLTVGLAAAAGLLVGVGLIALISRRRRS